MTRKRRYLISVAVIAACVCIALGVLATLRAEPTLEMLEMFRWREVILGTCCVVPFVVGVIAFFLMFRSGTHGENEDANYGKRPPAEGQGADAGSVTEDPR